MNKNTLLAIGAEIGLIATTLLYLALHRVWIALLSVALGATAVFFVTRCIGAARHTPEGSEEDVAVGIGTVRRVETEPTETAAGERQVWIEVTSVHGDSFLGRLVHDDSNPQVATLRPGLVVLVAFDPAEPEELSLPDDVLAVRASDLVFA